VIAGFIHTTLEKRIALEIRRATQQMFIECEILIIYAFANSLQDKIITRDASMLQNRIFMNAKLVARFQMSKCI
jgi:hypothetical protein